LAGTLAEFAAALGGARPAVVARELTKTHEEILRGTLGDLAAWAGQGEVRGEITLVVAGAGDARGAGAGVAEGVGAGAGAAGVPGLAGQGAAAGEAGQGALVAEVVERVAAGEKLSQAAAAVASAHHVPKRPLYEATLAARQAGAAR
jgi:16S rRNA (cytidine1402-2'-O)-methyltransferase